MASSLSNFVNNLPEGIHKTKYKYGQGKEKCENRGLKYKNCELLLEYTNFKVDLMQYKCLCCRKNYQQMFD